MSRRVSGMQIRDVRVTLADIPVQRPHVMSFTTLQAVNFVFVRLETAAGLVGWGEGRLPRRPNVERGVGGVRRGDDRAVYSALARRAGRHRDRGAAAGDGAPSPGNP